MTIRVAVVDDQPLLVSAFVALVNNEPDMEVVATGANGEQAVQAARETTVDVMLMDIRMPVMDGIEATREICSAGSRPHILVLTTFNVDELVLGALAAGARGFLLKDADPTAVLQGIRTIHRGEAVVSDSAAPHLLAALRRSPGGHGLDDQLTPRELEVLTLIARGLTNAEIARELFVAETTVKTHVGNLLLKLQARDRVALVVLAHTVGLVRP